MNAMTDPIIERKLVEFTLDGQTISAFEDQTLIEIAKEHGKDCLLYTSPSPRD